MEDQIEGKNMESEMGTGCAEWGFIGVSLRKGPVLV